MRWTKLLLLSMTGKGMDEFKREGHEKNVGESYQITGIPFVGINKSGTPPWTM